MDQPTVPGMDPGFPFIAGGPAAGPVLEGLLAKALDQARDAVFGTLPTARFFYVNASACQALGYDREELLALGVFGIDPEFPKDRWQAHWEEVRRGGGLVIETVHRRKDGTQIPVEVSAHILDHGGQELMFAYVRDLTEQKRAQDSLKASESKLRTIVESEPECVKTVSPEGILLEMNPAGLAMLEVEHRDEVIGKSILDWVAPDSREVFLELAAGVLQGESLTRTFEMIGKKGTRRWMESHAVPIRDADARITALLAVTRDITERRVAGLGRAATYQIAEAAQVTQDLQELYASIHGIIRDLMPAENFYIALHDPATGLLAFPYFVDACDPPPTPKPFGRGLTEYVIRTCQAQLLDETILADLAAQGEVEAIGAETLAWLGVPLRGSQGVLGALVVQSYGEGHVYTLAERDLLAFVSGQVALAIERKGAEEHQRFMTAAINRTRESIVAVDASGQIFFANPTACAELGYTLEELLSLSIYDINRSIPAGDWPRRWSLTPPEGTRLLSALHWRKDGQILSMEIATSRFAFEGRELIVAAMRDITTRQAAEAALRASEAKFAGAFHSSSDAISILRKEDGTYLELNDAFTRMSGWTKDEALGKNTLELGLYADPEDRRQALQTVRDTGEVDGLEIQFQRRDGSRYWGLISARTVELNGIPCVVSVTRNISRQKAVEEALRESEARQRSLFETMAEGVVYQDRNGNITHANPAAERILGLSLGQMLGKTSMDPNWKCIHQDGSEFPGQEHPAMLALASGQPVRDVIMGIFHSEEGRYRWALVSAVPQFEAGADRPSSVFATITDVTEFKAAQDELRSAERRLRTVLSNSPAVIYQLDSEGRFLLSEGKGLEPLGLQPGQVVGMSALELYQGSLETIAQLRRALAGEPVRGQTEVNGAFFDNLITPIRNARGEVESIIGIATDITARVVAEKAFREGEATYRGIFNAVNEAIYIQDRSGRFLDVNEGAVAMYGIPREQLIGQTPEQVTAPGMNDIPAVLEMVSKAFAGQPQEFEFWGRRGNGEVFPKEVKLYPGTYFGQEVVIALSVDISERRRTEEALRQSQKLESLGVLAGGIAHDFNNLLTAILGNLNLAQMKLAEASPATPHLEKAEKTVLKASELTKQMLAYSGKGSFEVMAHDLNNVVQEMLHLLQVSISKKVELRFHLDPELLPLDADATQIQQVVMNLVTNASEAIGEGVGIIGISTYRTELDAFAIRSTFPTQPLAPGPYVVLEVSDSGAGMGTQTLSRIFDPFFTTKVSGRGLGLSAMLGILRGHKAGIMVRSTEGKGSTFKLFFPASLDCPAPGVEAVPELSVQFRGTVLLVDDEEVILESTSAALEAIGFQVVLARDGLQALQEFQARSQSLSLVLMDLTMPHMDGGTAFLAMQRANPRIPVILSSGYDEEDFTKKFQGEGLAAFLQKPYQLKELRRVVQKVLGEQGGG